MSEMRYYSTRAQNLQGCQIIKHYQFFGHTKRPDQIFLRHVLSFIFETEKEK